MWQLIAMALALPVVAPAPAPAPPPSVDFSVGGVALTMPLPPGYCIPTGRDAAVAQLVAAGDKGAVTHATLKQCDGSIGAGVNDYTLIKTPTSMLMPVVDRPTLIKELGAEFDNPVAVADMNTGDAGADLSQVLGTKVEIKGLIKPLGHDDVCAYMGGQVNVTGAGISYLQPTGVCITSVGGKVVTIARYGKDLAPAAIATLLRAARAIALSMRTVRAK
ncbi:hypothetical protein QH494_10490 [Sphingomonas sp. AR_OL41]|jgi:hypothetical protein|uniref:hypothetical protein n=1 Tax=Sphingomonas sp. AR_OL41 TaxID=3042729 RepID=UPI002480FDEF|nr:hypothetical protein [Sphingomonas sp. AR_OL41]MDH7972610.1 hypothetical protein [Sphingomonas sp. AR_OL41]